MQRVIVLSTSIYPKQADIIDAVCEKESCAVSFAVRKAIDLLGKELEKSKLKEEKNVGKQTGNNGTNGDGRSETNPRRTKDWVEE